MMGGLLRRLFGRRVPLPSERWPVIAWTLGLTLQRRRLLLGLTLATVGAAATEGLGIAVLVPLLEAINRSANPFAMVPLVNRFAGLFTGWSVTSELQFIALLLVGVALLRSAFNYLVTMLTQLVLLTVDRQLRERVVQQARRLDFERLQAVGTPMLMSYASGLAQQTASFCSYTAAALANLAMLAVYVGLCLMLSWQLTLMASALLLVTIQFVRLPLMRRMLEAGLGRKNTLVEMNNVVYGGFTGAKLLRLVGGEERHAARMEASIRGYMANEQRYNRLQSVVDPLFQAVVALIISALLFASTIVFGEGAASRIPLLLLFLFVMSRLVAPIQTLNRVRLALPAAFHAAESVRDFLSPGAGLQEPVGGRPFPGLQRKVSFEEVGFQYRLGEGAAVDEVSFDIPARRMTALVGPSGAGKTTLTGLLTRLYRPQSGRISVDGIDIAEISLPQWRSRVAMVSQDTFLFDDTVAVNLRLARPDASDAEIEAAARQAGAHDFIMALPAGYQTVVGERGTRLSGGQQQRLAIARALVAKPDLLILDEATSNLDAETEHLVSRTLNAMVGRCAVLVIAHRLATVQRADTIIVLDRGRVVESGTHESLMRACGRYHGLVTRQMFAGGLASPEATRTATPSPVG